MKTARIQLGDRGSIPLALLVVIVVTGFVGVVTARSIAEQRATRFDNEYATALHAAEVGLEDALFRLNTGLVTGSFDEGSALVDGYQVEWTLEEQPDESWTATAEVVGPNDVTRTLFAEIRDRPIFELALATHLGVNFQGGNSADSYNSSDQSRCSLRWGSGSGDRSPSIECYGTVASNGPIDMGSSGGGNNYADRVRVHNWGDPDNRTNRCLPSNSIYCAAPRRQNINDPLNIFGQVEYVQELIDQCDTNNIWATWRASNHKTGSGPTERALFDFGPGLHCFTELDFDVRNIELRDSIEADNGLMVVVRDRLLIGSHTKLNCEGCDQPTYELPSARALQIFTLATDDANPAVRIRQQAKIGAAIYAPNASCGNLSSNAQVEIFGALTCSTVLNQGGWEFHYDEDLMEGLTTEEYIIARWEER